MASRQSVGSRQHVFADLRALLACTSPARSGDVLAGIAASNEVERMAARRCRGIDVTCVLQAREAPVREHDDAVRGQWQRFMRLRDRRPRWQVTGLRLYGWQRTRRSP